MAIRVRPAVPADIDWLLNELRQFSDYFGSKRSLYGDGVYAREAMLTLIRDALVLVAQRDEGPLLGFIAGIITPHLFNPSIRVLSETFWWVSPEFRGSRAGLHLLDAFVGWGRLNADWIIFSLEQKSPVRDECLTRRGFHLQERNFLMEVG